jgi:hypothetical protein
LGSGELGSECFGLLVGILVDAQFNCCIVSTEVAAECPWDLPFSDDKRNEEVEFAAKANAAFKPERRMIFMTEVKVLF